MPQETASLLTKYYIKAGITVDEYIVLNAYLNHSYIFRDNHNLNEVAEMTGKSVDEVTNILSTLVSKEIIQFDGNEKIDIISFRRYLSGIQWSSMSINAKIAESIENHRHFRYDPYYQHLGQVTMLPASNGGIAVTEGTNSIYGSSMWDKEDMKNLANEILHFVEQVDQKWIDNYNENREKKLQEERDHAENIYKERQIKKEQATQPKSGFVILVRLYPSGYYKFTYTTSIALNSKINRLKEEYGDTVEIIHSVETYDTMKFYHQFAKKQFSNRLVEKTLYQLTEEDVLFFKDEKYPANAMDWLEGSRVK
ncbi:hypothetical protein [Bacillus mycoides]|uniref:hypothetical protein n=1 Tax=Bacillus mycoides TaxID=1405 RepID=UPI0010BE76B7|nr:hypothetical protein [Bacillus mycoides]TKI43434.1 hypothetical protein FC700_12270 [Bacillus mycoides]